MKLIWTKSHKPLSVLIRWGLREPVSHFAIVFDDYLLFQSNLLGTNIDYFPLFSEGCEIVEQIEVPMDEAMEEIMYKGIMNTYGHKPYGWTAFLYFMWRGFLNRYLKIQMPIKNKWWTTGSYLCVGLAEALKNKELPIWLIAAVESISDVEMISPYRLYQIIDAASPKLELTEQSTPNKGR